MQLLRQSTATAVLIGPFIDDADGKSPETGLTVTSMDADLYKHSNTHPLTKSDLTITASGGSNDCAHVANGYYSLELTTGNTDTLGRTKLTVNISGAIPVWHEYMVVPGPVFDSLVLGTDYLQADAVQVEGVDATNQIRDAVVDDATRIDASALNTLSGYAPASTIAAQSDLSGLATSTALQTVDDNVDAILLDTGTDGVVLADNAITSAKIQDGALTATKFAAALCNKIADHVLRRNMATCRASSDGDGTGRFILQAFAFLRNWRGMVGGVLTVKQENDTTDDWTATYQTSGSAEPVTEIDPA